MQSIEWISDYGGDGLITTTGGILNELQFYVSP